MRYGSLKHPGIFAKYQMAWGTNLSSIWRGIWNYIEDARIEYQLLLDFPYALPYIAALRNLIREITIIQKPDEKGFISGRGGFFQEFMDVTRNFIRLGEYPIGWRAEMDFLAPRLTVVARSRNSEDSMMLANEYLAYVLLRRKRQALKIPIRIKQEIDIGKADEVEDIIKELIREERYKKGKPGQVSDSQNQRGYIRHILKTLKKSGAAQRLKLHSRTPWGAVGGKWKDILRAFATQLVSSGVSVSEIMEIHDVMIESSAFIERVAQERRDDIIAATEALKQIESRKTYYAIDGSVAIDKQQDAYIQSFIGSDEQGKVYEKKRRIPAEYDAIIVIDVSGSMSASRLTESAMSDAIVLLKAMQENKVRIAVFGVDDHLRVFKRFDDALEEARFNPRGFGGTDFQSFFTNLPKVAEWTHSRRLIFIISDGDWYWQPGKFEHINTMPFYQGVEWYIIFLRNTWQNNRYAADTMKNVFKQEVYPNLLSAISAATGMRWK